MRNRPRSALIAVLLVTSLVLAAAPGRADEYDSGQAGHPLRIAAYVLHPIGWTIETLLFRPAHWIVTAKPLATFFGHVDKYRETEPEPPPVGPSDSQSEDTDSDGEI